MSEDKNVSVQQLGTGDMEGFMTKCGGSVKNWKRRWFILKGNRLYYFKDKKDKKATGVISLSRESFAKEDNQKKPGKACIALGTLERVFFMYPDSDVEQRDWVRVFQGVIDNLRGNQNPPPQPQPQPVVVNNLQPQPQPVSQPQPVMTNLQPQPQPISQPLPTSSQPMTTTPQTSQPMSTPQTSQPINSTSSGGTVLVRSRDFIPFMVDDTNKVLEFWNIWFDSIPKGETVNGMSYFLVISCDGGELSWRASGPQNMFIQKMVDFFWNVGAPESEIDRLNDYGALVNPLTIGSWINMSKVGGMDGGWFFPVPLAIKIALEASDSDSNNDEPSPAGMEGGDQTIRLFQSWVESNRIEDCLYIGRDMGAAPPRQTEIRIRLSQPTVADQLNVALNAMKTFRFPDVPGNMLNILRQFTNPGIILSIILSSEGFVKLGILFPSPNWNFALQLIDEGRKYCTGSISSGTDVFTKLNNVFQVNVPEFIELQYLQPGFGYNVYKEDFNVLVHYRGN